MRKPVPLIVSLVACAVLLTGCVVSSVYPYYTQKDLAFDPALLGTWTSTSTNATDSWTFERRETQSYKMTVKDGEESIEYDAHLFRLKGQLFLDVLPHPKKDCNEDFIPPHYLLRVDKLQPTLRLRPLDYKWMGELLEKKPKALRHMKPGAKDDGFIVTADTAELQKFIIRHLKTGEAWASDTTELKRQ